MYFQTLDHLPLTNPENFGTPVIMESKKQRKRRKVDGPDRYNYDTFSAHRISNVNLTAIYIDNL